MKRIRRPDNYSLLQDGSDGMDNSDNPLQMQNRSHIRQEQTMEAEVLEKDSLQAISLRFNCSIADIKRLNKIDKDNEIFARKIVRIPMNANSVLLNTMPMVHKSGTNSPNRNSNHNIDMKSSTSQNNLPNNVNLEEKLILASVTNASYNDSPKIEYKSTDHIIDNDDDHENATNQPLLMNNEFSHPTTLRPPKNDFSSWNGSDCDLSWIFLLIVILALCVIVPLVYVLLIHEHPEQFHHKHSPYDDPDDLHFRHHLNDGKTTSKIIAT